jgi:SSS family solute:Na+ symporter
MVANALAEAKANGITEPAELNLIEAGAYPHYLHVMAILFVSNIIIMLLIGKFYPRKEPFQLEYTKQVSIEPWKHVKLASGCIAFIVIAIYIYFAK